MDVPVGVGAAIAFLFGASVGSFATTAAYRMPRDISIITPRSMCESCERQIPWWANIPIIAFIGLRGRCIMCGAPIRFRHFLTEAAL
ncbi:MAG TPA: prepilin peptidase, partial [Candidatus Binataceae bacterium]|nr:prepilin peptidase [Candidatus Binataceae bacterium]